MKAVIIDDEENSRELLWNMLSIYCKEVHVAAAADGVQSGFTAIKQHDPDLVFLDIQMSDGTGFDLLGLFGSIDFKVIFTTAYQEYAIRAFRFSAIDYLLKPISPEYLIKAVGKAEELVKKQQLQLEIETLLENLNRTGKEKKIVVKTHDRVYSVPVSELVRCESDGSYTSLFLENGHKIMVARQLKEFDELLSPDGFMRVHQSHLINPDFLFYYQKGDNNVIMKDQSVVPVATRKKDELLLALQQG